MQYRTDKRTGNELSALGFGCMRFPKRGGGFDPAAVRELITAAAEKGVNYLDTAYIYGNSEQVLGDTLKETGLRDKFYIATKLPLLMTRSGADFDKFFNKQLERLQTDRIDYYLMHMITDFEVWQNLKKWGIEEWIAAKKAAGQIGAAGFSYHGGRDAFPRILNDYDWDFCQIQYNYLDENNQAGRSGLELAQSKGLPVIVMEPLRGGKLAAGLPAPARDAFLAVDEKMPPAEWGLKWLWDQEGVTCVLSGMSDMAQLSENVRVCEETAAGSLTDKQRAAYGSAADALKSLIKVNCTSCGYCQPCPFGVDIPTCFASYNILATDGYRTAQSKYMQNINALGATPNFAGKCTGCGKCEKHCPQSIEIRKELKDVAKKLEPWWFLAGTALYRKLFKRK